MRSKYWLGILGIILLILGMAGFAWTDKDAEAANIQAAATEGATQIFFSAGCVDCWPFVQDVLVPTLQANGLAQDYEIHDYTIPEERQLLLQIADGIGLPRSIADSLYTFVPIEDGTLVILGHVPPNLIEDVIVDQNRPDKLVIWQPEMHYQPTEYRLWAWQGDVQVFPIDTSLEEALPQAIQAAGPLPVSEANLGQLLPAVIVTGLVDSVNPCAFAVILLLLAFLFTLRKSRGRILQLGLVYILMIFVVYYAIGLGILRAVNFSNDPHFVARAGSWLLILLGTINLIEYFFPNFPIKLHMPTVAGDKTYELINKATLPATMGAGLLVGLCTFPCSGGVYVSIITLLNAKTTLAWGLSYLGLYNVMFVLPLIVILLATNNKVTAKAWARWERRHSQRIRLWYGIVMVAIGVAMLILIIP